MTVFHINFDGRVVKHAFKVTQPRKKRSKKEN